MNWPGEPSGNTQAATWLKKFWAACKACEIINGVGYKVKKTPQGTIIDLDRNTSIPLHPFQLYRGSTWLKWKVYAGNYIYTSSGDWSAATNTDTEITITTGVPRYWFYIDVSTGAVAASSTRPTWSASVIPIGYVDTDTYSAEEKSVPYQFTHDNIFSPCD